MDIPFWQDLPPLLGVGLIVDAIFGFSFKGPLRPPFDTII